MPRIAFKSYRGNAWEYDIVSRKIAPANGELPRRPHQSVTGRFFRDMRGVSREEFDDQIENHAEILILNVTDRCNMRCKYCAFSGAYHGQRVHGVDSMSLDTALRAIDQFIARAGSTLRDSEKKLAITFYGGEPLLAFDLIKDILHQVHHVRYPRLSGRLTHAITTNGTLLSEEQLQLLSQYGVSLKISIDGPRDFHDRNRVYPDGSGTFDAVLRSLKTARDKFPDFFKQIGYIATLCPPVRYLERAAFFDTHPLFKGHLFLVAGVAITNCDLALDLSEQERDCIEFSELLRQMHEKAVRGDFDGAVFESGLFSQNLARFRQAQGESGTEVIGPNGCCIPGQRRIFVSARGEYFLCDKVAQNNRFSLGNTNSGVSTDRAWKIYNDYIAVSQADCVECPVGNICDYCPSSALEGDYMGIEQKRIQCASKLPYSKQLLELYASLTEDLPPDTLDTWIPPRLE